MDNKVQYTTSLEHVKVPIRFVTPGGQPGDPTGDAVEMAFIPLDQKEPVEADWNPAEWEIVGVNDSTRYLAICLVGPSGSGAPEIVLDPGSYGVFVRVTDTPEIPVVKSDATLTVV